ICTTMAKLEISLDHVDLQIIRIMQDNARTNNADIARELGMAPSAILERVKKLEQKEVILQYNARINPVALEQKMLSFISIKTQEIIRVQIAGLLIAEIPEGLGVHEFVDEDGYLIKLRTNDTGGLVDLMRNTLSKIEDIISTRTTIVLETVKEDNNLVIPSKD